MFRFPSLVSGLVKRADSVAIQARNLVATATAKSLQTLSFASRPSKLAVSTTDWLMAPENIESARRNQVYDGSWPNAHVISCYMSDSGVEFYVAGDESSQELPFTATYSDAKGTVLKVETGFAQKVETFQTSLY